MPLSLSNTYCRISNQKKTTFAKASSIWISLTCHCKLQHCKVYPCWQPLEVTHTFLSGLILAYVIKCLCIAFAVCCCCGIKSGPITITLAARCLDIILLWHPTREARKHTLSLSSQPSFQSLGALEEHFFLFDQRTPVLIINIILDVIASIKRR